MTTSPRDADARGSPRSERVERIYAEVRALPAADRRAFLDHACAGDPALRAEVESLLAHAAEAESFIGDVGDVVDAGDPIPRLNAALAGRYRVESEIGQGGMATVFRAEDRRHTRKVAIKVLRPELAAVLGADRFLAEIRTTAHLQHPHILPLFDSGQAGGFLYYVMPYVEGESLRARLDREKQLPVEDAVRIAKAVASALDYAHRQGVIHRDIKPANILFQDGEPVVSDFGIALAVGAAGGGRLTETGLSLGTPYYMSPEQATGDRAVGPPSDTWALGCVLHELLVGEPPYTGATAQAVLAKILNAEPASACTVRPAVPRHVDATIRKALERMPADRFTSAHAFAAALDDPAFRHGEVAAGGGVRFWRTLAFAFGVITLLLSAISVWEWTRSEAMPSPPVARVEIPLPEGHSIQSGLATPQPIAISPDGLRIAYAAVVDGQSALYMRDLADYDPIRLPGTEGARQPFFSPDGEWVGFFAGGWLFTVSVTGNAPTRIAEVGPSTLGGSWGPDEHIVYAASGGLFRVRAEGGASPAPIEPIWEDAEIGTFADDDGQTADPVPLRWPQHLPDGEHVLATYRGGAVAISLETMQARLVLRSAIQARYVDGGFLVFHEQPLNLRAIRFDPDRLEPRGQAVPLEDDVFSSPASQSALFAVSRTGSLLWVPGGYDRSLMLVRRDGRARPIVAERSGYRLPRFSPDGRRVLVAVRREARSLWMVDVGRGTAEPVQVTPVYHSMPVWHPDGSSYAAITNVHTGVIHAKLSDPDRPDRITDRPRVFPISWARDDSALFLNEIDAEEDVTSADMDIWWIDLRGDSTARELLATPAYEGSPMISPDGRRLAYVTDVTGQYEIWVRDFPSMTNAQRVSSGLGTDPLWSRDGSELFFRRRDRIMRVDASRGFPAPEPEELFRGDYDVSSVWNWDVNDAGEFVMIRSATGTLQRLLLAINVVEELRRRLPE